MLAGVAAPDTSTAERCLLDEIADGVYRVSLHFAGLTTPEGLTVNQFLILGEEPLLFHTGLRSSFADVEAAVERVVPLRRLRWLSFGHLEADECGSLDRFVAAAPHLGVCFGVGGGLFPLDGFADVPESAPASDVLDLGGRRVRRIPTPHAPHNAEAQVLFEEVTGTLLCGDLFTQLGPASAITGDQDIVERAVEAEAELRTASAGRTVPATLRRLADLEPRTLAVMHGSSFDGDGGEALRQLAGEWEARLLLDAASPCPPTDATNLKEDPR